MDKYKYHYERTPNYCYPNSDVLINKFNIKDESVLTQYERQLVAIRQTELNSRPIKGNFDFAHLKSIHRFLFQDVYHWAGDIRSCNISKQDLFCLAQHIDSYAASIFDNLKKQQFFICIEECELIESLVNLFGDINALHPFREGNGRSQREFINMLAKINGISLNFAHISADEMIEASHRINNGDNAYMMSLFNKNFVKLDIDVQLKYIEKYILHDSLKQELKQNIIQNSQNIKSL